MSTATDETELRVLLVDADEDDFLTARDIFSEFSGCRFQLDWITDFDEAVDTISRKAHDLYLIDDRLSRSNGLELIRIADAQECMAPMLLLTGRVERGVEVPARMEAGAEFLDKGTLDASLLGRAIRYTHRQKRHSELLERKVDERTAEIALTNRILHAEIADRKRAELALREADRRKDEFLATLAHELRNPLAPICNALEILRIAGDRPEIREAHRDMIDRQVRQMIRLIDDLLDISRISRGMILLRTERFELRAVISNAVESIRPMIDRAEHSLSVNMPDTPIEIQADPTRVAQILVNLLNNAARYTEFGGRITLDVARDESEVCIRIKDNGIGIPAEQLPHIFETFAQLQPSSEPSRSGLGIGLSLVRSLVQLHDGSIEVISEGEGCGSEFIVRIPIERPGAESSPG